MADDEKKPLPPAVKFVDLIRRELPKIPAWVGPYFLPKSAKLLLGGESKIGKSLLLNELARALATGTTAFGCDMFEPSEKARVLFIDREVGEYGMQSRLHKSYRGVSEADLTEIDERLYLVSRMPGMYVDTKKGYQMLQQYCESTKCDVLILDPASKLMQGDDSNNQDVARFFDTCDRLLKDFEHRGMSIVISHHFRKPAGVIKEGDEALDRLNAYNFRGAGKWFDDPDTLMTLVRPAGVTVGRKGWVLRSKITARHGEDIENVYFTVNEHDDLRVHYQGQNAAAAGAPDPKPQRKYRV